MLRRAAPLLAQGGGGPQVPPHLRYDPYIVLGVPRSASDQRVKAAYRRLVKRCHPDVAGGSEARFREVQQAFEAAMQSRSVPPRYPPPGSRQERADVAAAEAAAKEAKEGAQRARAAGSAFSRAPEAARQELRGLAAELRVMGRYSRVAFRYWAEIWLSVLFVVGGLWVLIRVADCVSGVLLPQGQWQVLNEERTRSRPMSWAPETQMDPTPLPPPGIPDYLRVG
eukprot:TRINITY_DN45038_c0_g1_i1.p1 TRINITY_DN45038_c0_g1~~TRINITY_DN45038_c0_g1_i1.p1  ORF type:complete len:247 (+),score=61.36 TRINITY_DN45038_c0_g1_i1:68-742(+)